MRVLTILSGVLMAATGAFCLINAGQTFMTMAFIIGTVMVFFGLVHSASYVIIREGKNDNNGWILIDGMLTLLLGIMILCNQLTVDIAVPMIFGMWMLTAGLLRIEASTRMEVMRKDNLRKLKDALDEDIQKLQDIKAKNSEAKKSNNMAEAQSENQLANREIDIQAYEIDIERQERALKKVEIKRFRFKMVLFTGIITAVIGLMGLINPFVTYIPLVPLLGFFLIMHGINSIEFGINMPHVRKNDSSEKIKPEKKQSGDSSRGVKIAD